MKHMKRWIAGILIFAMAVGMVPGGRVVKKAEAEGKKKPQATVSLDKVHQIEIEMVKNETGNYIYSAKIKNNGKDKIKKIQYIYKIREKKVTETPSVPPAASVTSGAVVSTTEPDMEEKIEQKSVILEAKNIKAGKKSKRVSCPGDYSGDIQNMKLLKVKIYSGTALFIRNYNTDSTSLKWAKPDKKAPVISGWVGINSYNGNDIFWTCYSDRKNSYPFKKYVHAKDNRDGTVKVKVDTSKINWKKEGVYKVYYTAKDSSGNTAKAWAKVQVFIPGTPERIADNVLRQITSSSASDESKARAIYSYVKGHCAYVDRNNHSNWRGIAVNGLRYRAGDCFTFYSMARLLLTRAGIPNIEVTRYPARVNHRHWWNLVYVRGGWYHLDTTPRRLDGRFCLMTDAQLAGWTRERVNPFLFQKEKYPKRAVKIISSHP